MVLHLNAVLVYTGVQRFCREQEPSVLAVQIATLPTTQDIVWSNFITYTFILRDLNQ